MVFRLKDLIRFFIGPGGGELNGSVLKLGENDIGLVFRNESNDFIRVNLMTSLLHMQLSKLLIELTSLKEVKEVTDRKFKYMTIPQKGIYSFAVCRFVFVCFLWIVFGLGGSAVALTCAWRFYGILGILVLLPILLLLPKCAYQDLQEYSVW
tara:strand:- start:277 stop:732 length:456 start_codon:yes stop_codon:yes gene_type:complete